MVQVLSIALLAVGAWFAALIIGTIIDTVIKRAWQRHADKDKT